MKKKYIFGAIGFIFVGAVILLPFLFHTRQKQPQIHNVRLDSKGKSELVKRIKIIQQNGARPRFSPDGQLIIFDRKNKDGFYDLYLSDLEGNIIRNLTIAGTDLTPRAVLSQRNNGNAVFHPSGNFIVFISEEEEHAFKFTKWAGDPGLGTFANLWATTPQGDRFWQLTNIPIKKNIFDKTPSIATVNPHFSNDGTSLVWTERYADQGGSFKKGSWGKWQIKMADFVVEYSETYFGDVPRLENETVILRAEDICEKCNYVTAMGFLPGEEKLIVAGNLSGQHEYGMDQYIFDLKTKELTNLQNTPEYWEEDASLTPSGQKIVYMTNTISQKKLDFENPNWPAQPVEREYYLLDTQSQSKKRLTFFNEPTAPEYLGKRILVAASDFSPDGRYLAGTLGVDFGDKKRSNVELKIILIEFEKPLR